MARKPRRVLIIGLVFLAVGVAFGGFFWWQQAKAPLTDSGQVKNFVIKKGESLDSVARRLKREGFLRNALAFKIWVQAKNSADKIQAGSFKLSPDFDFEKLFSSLTHGKHDVWVTFPEGWRREEFALELIRQGFEIDLADWIRETAGLEGYLFPDTYLFPQNYSQGEILGKLRDTFSEKITSGLKTDLAQSRFSLTETVILGSLIEREVNIDQDRPIVAGILIKRWQNDWPLEIDATVQYAKVENFLAIIEFEDLLEVYRSIEWWPGNIDQKDLKIDSPYNTRLYKNLPPGPICNPGLASIKAVLDYRETPYWFYLSDSQGRTHYAEDLAEHNANVAKYLR
ncbi:MAG: endolytic transglycosylase MltG [Candidatus Pacebacteria bacterium]|nr:endolytic transglycosylase MltG [Candidatus Paceibacterota bacterium]